MVALFFLSVALGSAMSGYLARFYTVETERAYFGVVGGVAIATRAAAGRGVARRSAG